MRKSEIDCNSGDLAGSVGSVDSALRIILRNWSLYLIGTFCILVIEFAILWLNPKVGTLAFPWTDYSGVATSSAQTIAALALAWVSHFTLLPLLRLGMINVATEAAAGGTPSTSDLLLPVRRARSVYAAWIDRGILIAGGLLRFALPGVGRWVTLTFMPIVAVRAPGIGMNLTKEISENTTWQGIWRVVLVRVFGISLVWIATDIVVSSALHASLIGGIVALVAMRLLVLPIWLGCVGTTYGRLSIRLVQSAPMLLKRRRGFSDWAADLDGPLAAGGTGRTNLPARTHLSPLRLALVAVLVLGLSGAGLAVSLRQEMPSPTPFHLERTLSGFESFRADARLVCPSIVTAAFFPGGETLAVGTSQGVEIRRVADFALLRHVELMEGWETRSLAIDPTGGMIAVGGYATVQFLDAETLDVVWVTEIGDGWVSALSFSASGERVYCGTGGKGLFHEIESRTGTRIAQANLQSELDAWIEAEDWNPCWLEAPDDMKIQSIHTRTTEGPVLVVVEVSRGNWQEVLTILWDAMNQCISDVMSRRSARYTAPPHDGIVSLERNIDTRATMHSPLTGEILATEVIPESQRLGGITLSDGSRKCFWSIPERRIVVVDSSSLGFRIFDQTTGASVDASFFHTERAVQAGVYRLLGLDLAIPWIRKTSKSSSFSWTSPEPVAVSEEVEWLLSWSSRRLRLWSLESGDLVYDHRTPYFEPCIGFVSGGNTGLVLSRLSEVFVVDLDSMEIRGVHFEAQASAVSPEGEMCGILDREGTLRIWRTSDWEKPVFERPMVDCELAPASGFSVLRLCGASWSVHLYDGWNVVRWPYWGESRPSIVDRGVRVQFGNAHEVRYFDVQHDGFTLVGEGSRSSYGELLPFSAMDDAECIAVAASRYVATAGETGGVWLHDRKKMESTLLPFGSGGALNSEPEPEEAADPIHEVASICFLDAGRRVAAVVTPRDTTTMTTWNGLPPTEHMDVVAVWGTETLELEFVSPAFDGGCHTYDRAGDYRILQACPAFDGVSVARNTDVLFWRVPTPERGHP